MKRVLALAAVLALSLASACSRSTAVGIDDLKSEPRAEPVIRCAPEPGTVAKSADMQTACAERPEARS